MKNKKVLLASSLLLIAGVSFHVLFNLLFSMVNLNSNKNSDPRLIFSGIKSILILGGITLLYCKLIHRKFMDVMQINRISFKQIILSMAVAIGTYIFAIGINSISSTLFNFIIKDSNEMSSVINNGSVLVVIIVIAILPPIFEEIFFRGIFLDAYEELNKNLKYFLITLIFATFHGNLMQIIYVMFMGIILLKVREYTGSLVGSIVFHATNNSLSLIVSGLATIYLKLLNKGAETGVMDKVQVGSAAANNVSLSMALMRSLIFFLIGGTILFLGLVALKNYKEEKEDLEIDEEEPVSVIQVQGTISMSKREYMLQYIPMGIYLIFIITIVVLQYL